MTTNVLDQTRAWFARFIVTQREEDLDLLAVWAAHTHVATEVRTSPRLVLTSATPGAGKTTVLEHLERLCHRGQLVTQLGSGSLLARLHKDGPVTVLLDEADRNLKGTASDDLVAIVNSGYKVGATRPVQVQTSEGGWQVEKVPTFGPLAMAGNAPRLPDDTKSRCVTVLLMRDIDSEAEESDWEIVEEEAKALARELRSWAAENRTGIKQSPASAIALPNGVTGRAKEVWRPLKRVAMAAGGDWPERVDRLAEGYLHDREAEAEAGLQFEPPHVLLMKDIGAVWFQNWPKDGRDFTETSALLSLLHDHNPSEWGPTFTRPDGLTPAAMGRMLATHWGIRSTRTTQGLRPRGYALDNTLVKAMRSVGATVPDRGISE